MVDAMDGAKTVERNKGSIACDVTCYVLYYSLRHITGQLSCFVTFVIGGVNQQKNCFRLEIYSKSEPAEDDLSVAAMSLPV